MGLMDDEMWEKALAHDLTQAEYRAHVCTVPREDLVLLIHRESVLKKKENKKLIEEVERHRH
jgi:hypothetical protein